MHSSKVCKPTKLFSSIALDRCHEQVNAVAIGEGGAVGLTANPAAIKRWMVAGRRLSRMVQEFEGSNSLTEENVTNHEKPAVQNAFFKDVLNTVSSYQEIKNLMAIHNKDIMDDAVVRTVRYVRKIGEEQFNLFFKERFIDRSKPVTHPLKENNLPTLSTPKRRSF